MFGDLVDLDYQQSGGEFTVPDQQVLSSPNNVWNWDFPQDENGPVINWGDQGALGMAPPAAFNGGFNVGSPSTSFTPGMAPAPAPGMAPAPLPGAPAATPMAVTPPPGPSAATASAPLGSPLSGDEGNVPAGMRGSAGAAGAPRLSAWQPGSQTSSIPAPATDHQHAAPPPNPTVPGDNQPSTGGFDWKKMLAGLGGSVASSGTQALIGGGLSLLGSKLASNNQQPQARPQSQPGAQAASSAVENLPAPTTPTGTPNIGVTTPPPGSRVSPLFGNQFNQSATSGMNTSALGMEAQKRMRRGGQTGGMALY